MSTSLIFYTVFLSQIFLLSIYFPRKVLGRIKTVCEEYPETEYPKLYVKPALHYQKMQKNFKSINNSIFILGLILIAIIEFSGTSLTEKWVEMIPCFYFMLQLIPLFLIELSECSAFKQMKLADNRTKRQAILEPRGLLDFVSPYLILTAVAFIFATICLDIYVNQHIDKYLLNVGKGTFFRTLTILLANVLFITIACLNVYGKKLDPYQDNKDRFKQISVAVKSLLYISIGMSVFLMVREGTDDLNIEPWNPMIMSIYCLIIGVASIAPKLKELKLEDINFDVYKKTNKTVASL